MEETIQTRISELLDKSKKIAILPASSAGIDSFAAGLGLYLMLKNKDKSVFFIYQGQKPSQFTDLIQDSEIISNVNQRELLVSIDYSGTSADKVSYATNNNVFTIKIGPVDKFFDTSKVKSSVTGYNFDLIIIIGADNLQDLGNLSKDLEEELSSTAILNIDNAETNQRFGQINIVEPSVESLSLLVLNNALQWNLNVVKRAALALLRGMTSQESVKA